MKAKELSLLKVRQGRIVDERGKEVILRGLNLGGWLLMEGYLLGGSNIPESAFKSEFLKRWAREGLRELEDAFRKNFIQEYDIKNIRDLGANCMRIPFNFRLVEKRPYVYNAEGIAYLDKLTAWCSKYRIYCILDLHAACGSQNPDWHADSQGKALLWEDRGYRARTIKLWEFLVKRYKDERAICGYDLLNEPVLKRNTNLLRRFYKELIYAIRKIDKNHIIFLEGNLWAQDIKLLEGLKDENLSFSIHFYQPLDFVFNFQPYLSYPGKLQGQIWDKKRLRNNLKNYYKISKRCQVPIFVGELGVNLRCKDCFGELIWLRDTLDIFKEFRFHWTYWTYKAIATSIFPNGLYQYLDNPPWVNRQGPIFGWENLYRLWKKNKSKIISSWRTENFVINRSLSYLLRRFLSNLS